MTSANPTSGTVSSVDQTTIAFDRYGDGSPVIVLGGASDNLAAVTYDRRGRGDSTNNDRAFEPERELEDLSAIIEALGGCVSVFGHSSGAVLALEAAMQRLPIERLAVYEPPYVVDGTRPLPPDDLDERLMGWFATIVATTRDHGVLQHPEALEPVLGEFFS